MAKNVLVHACLLVGEFGSQGDPPDAIPLAFSGQRDVDQGEMLTQLPNS